MPCHSAMITDFSTVHPDDTVSKVLKLMQKKGLNYICVTDDEGALLGLFSYQGLFKNALPVSVSLGQGDDLSHVRVGAAPGLVKRLQKIENLPVGQFLQRGLTAVHPQTPIWEGVHLLSVHQEPLLVIDPETDKLKGIITTASALAELNRLKDSIE